MLPKKNYIKDSTFYYFFSVLISSLLITTLAGCGGTASKDDVDTSTLNHLPLNDTGGVFYTQTFLPGTTDPAVENLLTPTPDSTATGQDADLGRDASENDSIDGLYGFQFIKLDENGQALSNQSAIYSDTPWDCVKDVVTGLIWEVKAKSGLRMSRYHYTWYEPDSNLNGGFSGTLGPPEICGSYLVNCDTLSYKEAVNNINNEKGLCGLKNWRLPLREELRSIINYGSLNDFTIDTNFFPNTSNEDTWTSQTAYYDTFDGTKAWEVHFNAGYSEGHLKSSESVVVRLVHNP